MSTHQPEITTSEQSNQPSAVEPPAPRLSVIGIGASAGGLVALRGLFAALPHNSGLTFVVVVHLSPEHESILADLLQPYTSMPVVQVRARTAMQRDHVYVIPPAKHLIVTDNTLDLIDYERNRHAPMQIDSFFRSLAENHGDGGAIILSGSGSDGAVGIQAIKEKGGLIFVQAPDETEYDGMPRSAIATGLVDVVAPVADLAAQLVAAKQTHPSLPLPADGEALSESAQQTLTQILMQLRVRTAHDFSGYKPATLLRRVARRMQLTQLTTLTAYLHRLRQDSAEVEALFRDLLINVTEFFRDKEAWATLEATVIPQLFVGKGRDDTVRIWSVGCATGEEAYSVMMLLLEYTSTLVAPPTLQVFASDLSKTALDFAREGSYPAAVADDIPEERLERFFTKENNHYRARPELREAILFTQHNLLQDPPFSKLDLILCRNLLIYIQRDLQEQIFETFYYALRPQGRLFLGNAESAEGVSELFETLDKRHRLYQRRARGSEAKPILPTLPLLPHARRHLVTEPAPTTKSTPGEEHRLMLESMAPPSILVDRDNNVLHLSETAGRYLLPPGGAPTTDLLKLIRPQLQGELRIALFRAFDEHKAVFTQPVPVQFNGAPYPVVLLVRPHEPPEGEPRALVIFLEDETPVIAAVHALDDGARQQAEAELRHIQGRLQSMREEYESTVEELRAANEELQSTNEEYKSTLEELETSKEELQSINEELQTINQELKNKVEEVSEAHNDLQNLFVATDIATLFLDRELRVKRYTPRSVDLFNLMPPDKGRPIAHLRTNLAYEQLDTDARRVLSNLTLVEREVQSRDGRWFLGRIRPYRTLEDRIDGVVLTFVDITSNKQNELALRNAKEYAESIVHTIPDALLVLDPDLRVQMANDAFYEIFQTRRDTTEGRLIYELSNNQWQIPALRTLLEEILPDNKVFTGYEVSHNFESIGRRTMLLNGRRLDHVQLILLAITDITERKRAEEAVRDSEERMRWLLESAKDFAIFTTDPARRVNSWNAGAEAMCGYREAEIIGQSADLLFVPEDRARGAPEDEERKAREQGRAENERWHIRQDGSRFYGSGMVNPLRDDAGEIVGFVKILRDLTAQKQAEEDLRASEEKYRTLFESIDEGFCIIERVAVEPLDFRYLEANPAFAVQSGIQDVIGKTIRQVVPGEPEEWFAIYDRVLQTRAPIRFERALVSVGRVLELYAFPVASQADNQLAVIFNDITERKHREANLAFLAEVSADFAPLSSMEEVMQRVGVRLAHHLKLSRCDFSVVDEPADLITTIFDWRVDEALPSVLGEHRISTFLNAAGRQTLAAGNISVIDDVRHSSLMNAPAAMMQALGIGAVVDTPYLEHGRWCFLLSACRAEATVWRADEIELIRELTTRLYIRLERARAEAALRQSEERFRALVAKGADMITISDRNGYILYASPTTMQVTGYTPEEFMQQHPFDSIHPDDRALCEGAWQQLAATPGLTLELQHRFHHKDGSWRWLEGSFTSWYHDPVIGGLVANVRDITTRKEAAAALQQLNATLEQQVDKRTAQVRALASELTMAEQEERRRISQILHDDLQQLLYGVQMRMMAMMNDLKTDNNSSLMIYAQEAYNWMSDAIQTTRRLTVDLSPPLLTGEGLADALRWLIPQMATVNGLQATLEVVEPCVIPSDGMRVLLFQIVRELLFNVVKHAGVNTATVLLRAEGNDCVISVRDPGRGFDPAAVSTKGEKGFGLFSINERLKLFGGHMTIQSAPGQGTQITIYAPVNTGAQMPS